MNFIDELREACDKATDLPWEPFTPKQAEQGLDFFGGQQGAYCFMVEAEQEDIDFISLANPQTMRWLLDMIGKMREQYMYGTVEEIHRVEAELRRGPTPKTKEMK